MQEDRRCTPDLIKAAYEGGLAVTGLGSPLEDRQDAPLDCYEGYTSRTLHAYIQEELVAGYPPGQNQTGVARPHDQLINLAVDGMCMFALTMRHMMFTLKEQIENLRTPSQTIYARVVDYMKNRLRFTSASGGFFPIRGSDGERRNDLANFLAIWQSSDNVSRLVGHVDLDGNRNLSFATGLRNESWTAAPDETVIVEEESFPVLAVVIPTLALFFCGIVCYAAYSGRGAAGGVRSSNQA